MDDKKYLEKTEIVDFDHPEVLLKAKELSKGLTSDEEIGKKCFLFVRDEIRHSGDHKDSFTTFKASEVLEKQAGWCYAKSILLTALLRANNIPTGFCYQRLSCSEYKDDIYCLHGLNAIYLKEYGWYKIDARGNKEGVDAQFTPPKEKLAFELGKNEYSLNEIYSEPIEEIVNALLNNKTYEEMINNFPDTNKR